MPYYTDDAKKQIAQEFRKFQIDKSNIATISGLLAQIAPYNNPRAEIFKFAYYGVGRRLKIMSQCVENVFNIRPIDIDDIPTEKIRLDLTINLQCFLMHLYGTLENLAWVYSIHTNFNGSKFDKSFFAKKQTLLKTLPQDIQKSFMGDGKWVEYVKMVRDFLAHQEPFYIPPNSVNMDKEKEWRSLEAKKNKVDNDYLMALFEMSKSEIKRNAAGDRVSIDILNEELKKQNELKKIRDTEMAEIEKKQLEYMFFTPWVVVGTNDSQYPIMQFYPQMLVDIKTTYEKVILILEHIVRSEK